MEILLDLNDLYLCWFIWQLAFTFLWLLSLCRPTEAEILRPDSKWVLHSSNSAPGRQGFDGQTSASGSSTATAWHGIVTAQMLPHLFNDHLKF